MIFSRTPLSNSELVVKDSRKDLLKVLKKSKVTDSSDMENFKFDDGCLSMPPTQYEECEEIERISNSMVDRECKVDVDDSLSGNQLNISNFSKICVSNGDNTMFQFDDEIQVRNGMIFIWFYFSNIIKYINVK